MHDVKSPGRILSICGSYYNIRKAIFYLLKRDYMACNPKPSPHQGTFNEFPLFSLLVVLQVFDFQANWQNASARLNLGPVPREGTTIPPKSHAPFSKTDVTLQRLLASKPRRDDLSSASKPSTINFV